MSEREREGGGEQEVMFASVWYAKKMGRRFINNVRRAKRHRQRMMVGAGGGASPLNNQIRRNTPVSVRRRD